MTVFADSSALVKLYADEDHSEVVHAVPAFVVSLLARVEVPAALWAKHRGRFLTVDQTVRLLRRFEADFRGAAAPARFAAVPVTPAIVSVAAAVAAGHGLRAYDAVQLATARAARGRRPRLRPVRLLRRPTAEGRSGGGVRRIAAGVTGGTRVRARSSYRGGRVRPRHTRER